MLQQTPIRADGKRTVLYVRVSTEEQVDNFSLNTQEEICRREAEKRGYDVIEVFKEEGRSAKNISGRPILISLLEYARKNKNKFHAVFVYRLDRISRITADYLAIRKKLAENGVSIVSATEPTGDSPTEKLVETILAGFAQLDNDIRSERAKNGLRARFIAGLISGKPPLGYIFQTGYAVKDPKSWDKMKQAWDLMATGTKSLSQIADIMNGWGLREIHGKKEYKLRCQSTSRIFRFKFYMGVLTSTKYPDVVRGQHVPMITEEQFYKVQAYIDGRNPNIAALSAKRNFENIDFPLRRIVTCGKCGVGLTGGWSTGKMGVKYPYYWCASKCNYKCIRVAEAEQMLIDVLRKLTPTRECTNLFFDFLYRTYYERLSRLKKIKNEADMEIADLKLLRKALIDKNLSGVYSDEIFKEQNALIEDKMIRSQIAKDDSTIDKYNIDTITSFMKTILADLGETYRKANIKQLKVLSSLVFATRIAWSYNGTLNYSISPLYQSILTFDKVQLGLGAGDGN